MFPRALVLKFALFSSAGGQPVNLEGAHFEDPDADDGRDAGDGRERDDVRG